MAMVQRDKYIDEIQKTDALLEYAVIHGDDVEAERLRRGKSASRFGMATTKEALP